MYFRIVRNLSLNNKCRDYNHKLIDLNGFLMVFFHLCFYNDENRMYQLQSRQIGMYRIYTIINVLKTTNIPMIFTITKDVYNP